MFDGATRTLSPFRTPHRAAPSLADTRLARLSFLSADELGALKDCAASRQSVNACAELVGEGVPADRLFFIEEGWACQYTTTRDGRRQILALSLPGDVCDPAALLLGQRDSGIRMLSSGTVLSVPRKRLVALAAAHPGITRAFTLLGFVDNAILSRRALSLGRLFARERLAHLLCELAVRLGHGAPDGMVTYDMPLTQEHLADALGLTPVHINRTMQALRRERLVESSRRMTTIFDVAVLRRIGGFQPDYLHIDALEAGTPAERAAAHGHGLNLLHEKG